MFEPTIQKQQSTAATTPIYIYMGVLHVSDDVFSIIAKCLLEWAIAVAQSGSTTMIPRGNLLHEVTSPVS